MCCHGSEAPGSGAAGERPAARVLIHYYHGGSLGHGRRVMALAGGLLRRDPAARLGPRPQASIAIGFSSPSLIAVRSSAPSAPSTTRAISAGGVRDTMLMLAWATAYTDDDLADLPVASSKAVDVVQFVDAGEIDPAAYSRPYYAMPAGDAKPWVLLRDALASAGKVAVVKLALRSRERLAVLRPSGDALVVQTMLWPDEVRAAEIPDEVSEVDTTSQEMAMAQTFIDTLTGAWDPDGYTDDYRAALEELVQVPAPHLQHGLKLGVLGLTETLSGAKGLAIGLQQRP